MNGKSIGTSGAEAGLPASKRSIHAAVPCFCLAFQPGRLRKPITVAGGTKLPPEPASSWKSIQYVPGGSVNDGDTVSVFRQMRLVVPGVVPGGGTTLFAVRNIAPSTEEVNRFVEVSPKTIELPVASGGPFQILRFPAMNGLDDPPKPV
jgi:hypothetical protein